MYPVSRPLLEGLGRPEFATQHLVAGEQVLVHLRGGRDDPLGRDPRQDRPRSRPRRCPRADRRGCRSWSRRPRPARACIALSAIWRAMNCARRLLSFRIERLFSSSSGCTEIRMLISRKTANAISRADHLPLMPQVQAVERRHHVVLEEVERLARQPLRRRRCSGPSARPPGSRGVARDHRHRRRPARVYQRQSASPRVPAARHGTPTAFVYWSRLPWASIMPAGPGFAGRKSQDIAAALVRVGLAHLENELADADAVARAQGPGLGQHAVDERAVAAALVAKQDPAFARDQHAGGAC